MDDDSNKAVEDVLESEPTDNTLKYLPSLDASDPIITAMLKVCKVEQVRSFEMLDSRWNGNEGATPKPDPSSNPI